MVNQNSRAHANLAMLEFVARKLDDLKDEFVFLGGCATALFITDDLAPDVRSTLDVDCIVDVLSLRYYHQLEKRLMNKGFKKSLSDSVICRWHYENMILDVMPTDQKILGFGNYWYKAAMEQTITHQLAKDLSIKSVTAPYFLATKLEAFRGRGRNDYLASHDFEDIITIIDGRVNLLNEIESSSKELKVYLGKIFTAFLKDDKFVSCLPGHLNYGKATLAREKIVSARIKKIANIINE